MVIHYLRKFRPEELSQTPLQLDREATEFDYINHLLANNIDYLSRIFGAEEVLHTEEVIDYFIKNDA